VCVQRRAPGLRGTPKSPWLPPASAAHSTRSAVERFVDQLPLWFYPRPSSDYVQCDPEAGLRGTFGREILVLGVRVAPLRY